MKRIKLIIIAFVAMFLAIPNVKAASLVTSASTVYPGQTFTASVTVVAASWNIHTSVSGPVSGCIMNDANASDTAMNITKTVTTTCTATGVGTININLYGDYTPQTGGSIDLGGTATVQVVNPPPQPPQQPQQPQRPQQTYQPQPQVPKSSNNFLKSLKVEGCSITPTFDKNVLEYSCKDLLIDKIEIKAEQEDSKAMVSGTGTKELLNGDNNFEVSVTAEDGQVKVYKLLINKKNIPSTKILKLTLGNTDYKIDDEFILFGLPKDTKTLDLKVQTDSTTADVNITGNDNLKPGINVINISVTDTDCVEKIYKVIVYIQEEELLENNTIKELDKNYIINMNKNSSYVLNKDILKLIGTNNIKYNIIDNNYGLIASLEINGRQELEKDYELYFIINDNKIYTNIFTGTKIKAFINNICIKGKKLYIYSYDEKNNMTLVSEQNCEDYYVTFDKTESNEYLITSKANTKAKVKKENTPLSEIMFVIVFQVVLLVVLINIVSAINKKKFQMNSAKEKNEVVETTTVDQPVIIETVPVEDKKTSEVKEEQKDTEVI